MHKLIKLGPYKELDLPPAPRFTDDELNLGAIEAAKKLARQWAKAHKPAEFGDDVVINLRAEANKLFVPELSKANYTFTLGDPSIYEQFNQLTGRKAGEKLELVLELPDGFPVERMQGKTVTFYITLQEVVHKRPLELSDEIASQIDPEVGSLEQLKNKLKKVVSENWLQTIAEARMKAIMETVLSASVYELDQDDLKAVFERILAEKQKQLFTSGNPHMLEAMLSGNNQFLNKESLLLAEKAIVEELILTEIAQTEKIRLEPLEFLEAKQSFLEFAGDEQSLSRIFPTDESLRQYLMKEKVLDCLWDWNIGTNVWEFERP